QRQEQEFPKAADSPEGLLRAGELQASTDDFRAAVLTFDRVGASYPNSVFATRAELATGHLYLKQNRYLQAEKAFSQALRSAVDKSNKAAAELGLGRVAQAGGDLLTAQKHYLNAIDLAGDEIAAEAQFRIAQTFEAEQQYKKAAVEFLKVKYLYGSYLTWVVPAVYQAALANEKMQLWGEARKLYQSILDNYKDEQHKRRAQERLQAIAGQ
ncbi:MAG: tetratricopeptide repeat protein, partial [bacterium]